MTPQDALSLLITFGIGAIVGGYLYVSGFATTFAPKEAPTADRYAGLVVMGESYGDCLLDASCMSFQALDDRSYSVLLDTDVRGERDVTRTGSVPRQLHFATKTALTPEALAQSSVRLEEPNCGYEGTNFRFTVSLDAVEYQFDTCNNAIDYNGTMWTQLTALWNYFTKL